MTTAWPELLSLRASHAAYGANPPLSIRPAHDTAETLTRSRCRMRGNGAKASVWFADADGWTPAKDLSGPALLFLIEAEDQALRGATEPDWIGDLSPGMTLFFKGGAAPVPTAVRAASFEHRFSTPQKADLSVVAFGTDEVIWSQSSHGFARRFCDVTLGAAPEGQYVLKVGDQDELTFLLLRGAAAPFAGLEIEAAAATAARFGADQTPPAYAAAFAARALTWVYRVFPSPGADLTGAYIEGASFSAGKKVVARGRTATVFTSSGPIPLGAPVSLALTPSEGVFASVKLPVASPLALGRCDGEDVFLISVYL